MSLASPDWMTCAGCRYAGAPEPNVREGLYAAREALWAVDARRRQLGWAQQRIGAGARSGGGIGCLFAILVAPFAGCGSLMFFGLRKGNSEDVGQAAFFLGPAIFILLVGGLISYALKKTRAKLEQACAAVPPAVPGAPPGCHVCGADLPAVDLSRQAVVRCKYCQADNVIRPDVMQGAVMAGVYAADSLLAQVNAHAKALVKHRRHSSWLLAALALVAPVASCAGFVAVAAVAPEAEPTDDLVLYRAEDGACVARRGPTNADGTQIFYHSRDWVSFPPGDLPTFRAKKLVGLRGKASDGQTGKVKSVARNAFMGGETARFEDGGLWFGVDSLCFDEPPEGFEVLDPAESSKALPSSSAKPKSPP